jgi:hypothetical protein
MTGNPGRPLVASRDAGVRVRPAAGEPVANDTHAGERSEQGRLLKSPGSSNAVLGRGRATYRGVSSGGVRKTLFATRAPNTNPAMPETTATSSAAIANSGGRSAWTLLILSQLIATALTPRAAHAVQTVTIWRRICLDDLRFVGLTAALSGVRALTIWKPSHLVARRG